MSGAVWFLLLVAGLEGLAAAHRHDLYSGYRVWTVPVESPEQAAVAAEVAAAAAADELQRGAPGRPAHYIIEPQQEEWFLAALQEAHLTYELLVPDVATKLKEQDAERAAWRASRRAAGTRALPFEDYPRYDEIVAYLEELAAAHPDTATLLSAGVSSEGRDVPYMLLSAQNSSAAAAAARPLVFLEAMLHAREWVTTPALLYALQALLEGDGADLLQDVDFLVLPLANPDGYEYTHTDERLWRRTRSVFANETCVGVDANRNFDVQWNTTGVSQDRCSNTYPGPEPFSEPECQHVRDLLLLYANRTQVFVDVHSYGNYVLYGWGDGSLAGGVAQHHAAAAAGAAMDAVKLDAAPYYLVGNSGTQLYSTSGTAQDYGQLVGIPISLTFELPGYGYLFQVPPELMAHVNEETWRGFVELARLARLHHLAQNTST